MEVGTTFGEGGRYRIDALLGQGGMGSVWRAWDGTLRRDVAVKFLESGQVPNRMFLARLRREAQVLASLKHPRLVPIYGVDFDASPPWVIQEYLAGRDLEALVDGGELLGPAAARALLDDLTEAVEYLHANGILHRDIKPANVKVEPDGRARLMDFGLAFLEDRTRLTGTSVMVGTLAYMPPEVLTGGEYSAASDVYQVGLVVHVAATGRHLHGDLQDPLGLVGAMRSEAWRAAPPAAELPADLREVVAACCARDPRARPRDGAALRALTARARSGRPPADTTGQVPAVPLSRRPVALPLAVIVLLVALLVGALAVRFPAARPPAQAVSPELALEWARLPGGFALVVPGGGLRAPRWRLAVDGRTAAEGAFAREGDAWAACAADVTSAAEARFSVFDGDSVAGSWPVTFPASAFADGPTVTAGLEAARFRWSLHGRASVDVEVALEGSGVAGRARSLDGSAFVPLSAGSGGAQAAWALALRGSPLARGRVFTGPTARVSLPFAPERPRDFCKPCLPVVAVGGALVAAMDKNYVVGLRPVEGPSGRSLAAEWYFGGGRVEDVGHPVLVAPDGDGAVVLVTKEVSPRILGFDLARRRELWEPLLRRTPKPSDAELFAFMRTPAARAGEWEAPLEEMVGRAFWSPAGGRRLLLTFRVLGGGATVLYLVDPGQGSATRLARLERVEPRWLMALGDRWLLFTAGPEGLAAALVSLRDGRATVGPSLPLGVPDSRAGALGLFPRPVLLAEQGLVAFAPPGRLLLLGAPGAGALAVVRALDLPLGPEARLQAVLPQGGGRVLLAAFVPEPGAPLGAVFRVALVDVDLAAAGAAAMRVELLDQRVLSLHVRWDVHGALTKHRGRLYCATGSELLVLGDRAPHALAAQFPSEAFTNALVPADDAVYVFRRDGSVLGLDTP